MSESSVFVEETDEIQTFFQKELESSSSEEPPMEEWSSLIVATAAENYKMEQQKLGLYDPGSGEICTKYIRMSDSSVLRHVYYNYPAVTDPGIENALLMPEPVKIYDYNGQELYLHLCDEMKVIPVRLFYRGLLEEVIDLRYYGVNPVGVRAMCIALTNNRYVTRLDLTSNYLSEEACYHLGQLLGETFALQELVLASCKIRVEGVRRLVRMMGGRTLNLLDLSKNDIGDDGFQYLANQIKRAAVIKHLNLSSNDLTDISAMAFAEALDYNNSKITHLDLSRNKFYALKTTNELLKQLGEDKVLQELNLSWNGLTVGILLRIILNLPELRVLDLSNNRLALLAAKSFNLRLKNAKKLETLNLSYNLFTPVHAFMILTALRDKNVVLTNLIMDDVGVTKEFIVEMNEILDLEYRADTRITYGWVFHNYTLTKPDLRDIVLKRLDYVACKAGPKCNIDIMLYLMEEFKIREPPKAIQQREVQRKLKYAGVVIDEGLVEEMSKAFPGPKLEKGGNTIDLAGVVEFITRLWPDKKLPLTPPPAPPAKHKRRKGKEKTK